MITVSNRCVLRGHIKTSVSIDIDIQTFHSGDLQFKTDALSGVVEVAVKRSKGVSI